MDNDVLVIILIIDEELLSKIIMMGPGATDLGGNNELGVRIKLIFFEWQNYAFVPTTERAFTNFIENSI